MARSIAKTLKTFLGMLYTLKVMLPCLTALSKSFQTGTINFTRIAPMVVKTKTTV